MKIKLFVIGAAGCAGLFTGGCTFPSRSTVYDRRSINQMQHVELGTVESVRSVAIAGQRTAIGTLGGAAVGQAAASGSGQGVGRNLAQAGGAVVGAVVGEAAEEGITRKPGLELTIKLDGGNTVVVAQESPPQFVVGDRVRVLTGGGMTRVSYLTP